VWVHEAFGGPVLRLPLVLPAFLVPLAVVPALVASGLLLARVDAWLRAVTRRRLVALSGVIRWSR